MSEEKVEADKEECLLWADVETNGVHAEKRMIEIAFILTNTSLTKEFARFSSVCIPHDFGSSPSRVKIVQKLYDDADPYVRDMHTKNGLWDALKNVTAPYTKNLALAPWLKEILEENNLSRPLLAGSTVHFDLGVIQRELPDLAALLHYRVFDVSSLKRAVEWWTDGIELPRAEGDAAHRAMADIEYSLREARAIKAEFEECFASFENEPEDEPDDEDSSDEEGFEEDGPPGTEE